VYAHDYTVKTVFIGGGTPSIYKGQDICDIVNELKSSFENIRRGSYAPFEVTIECNPGTVDYEKLVKFRECGINRISFGLQSADNDELKKLGRIHRYEDWVESVVAAKKAGFENINVDLISGLVGQSVATSSQLNRLPDFEKVLWKMMEFESELDKLPPGGREHWARKVSKFIASVYHICMIKNPDKKSKREYLEWFNSEIEKRSPYIYSCVINKYKVFKLFNKLHMSEDFYAFVFGPALKFAKKYLGVGKLYV